MRRVRAVLSRFRGTLIYAAICAVVLLSFRERAWQHVSTLNGEEWHPIQTFVRANRQADEPICFLPLWTAGHATDQYKFRGIERLDRPEEAWADHENPRSFWVVSQFGAFDADDVPVDLYPHRDQVDFGGANIWVFRRQPFTLPDSLSMRLREASCALTNEHNQTLELVWNRTGHIVPWGTPNRRKIAFLGCRPSESRFAGRSHSGIWFHPPVKGSYLTLTWPRIELEPWLAVSGGIRDRQASRRAPPVKLAVLLDGVVLKTLSFPSERGWKTHAVGLGAERQGKTGRLSFKVWAKKNHSRHFIFDATFERTRPNETKNKRPRRGGKTRERRTPGGHAVKDGGSESRERTPDASPEDHAGSPSQEG